MPIVNIISHFTTTPFRTRIGTTKNGHLYSNTKYLLCQHSNKANNSQNNTQTSKTKNKTSNKTNKTCKQQRRLDPHLFLSRADKGPRPGDGGLALPTDSWCLVPSE
mmetsp:Transcript_18176/g.27407  ORF Transcript_18176/g.27407 Transcript_18176/m.27407 type:complete len:106 (-) Transcript_18176:75-392(-)